MTCGIYMIVCFRSMEITKDNLLSITDKDTKRLNQNKAYSYIGSSKNIERRLKQHKNALKKNIHFNIVLQRAYNKYGPASFRHIILASCEEAERTALEYSLIKELRPTLNLRRSPWAAVL